jgi:hypothetical protein
MQKCFRSVALFKKLNGDSIGYLVWRTTPEAPWQFIVGSRLGRESFRETVIREVAWQLKLDRTKDFIVASMAQLSKESIDAIDSSGRKVHLAVAFYPVHVYRSEVFAVLDLNPGLRWVSSAEVCDGKTRDGEIIDPQVVAWIKRWDILPAWQH